MHFVLMAYIDINDAQKRANNMMIAKSCMGIEGAIIVLDGQKLRTTKCSSAVESIRDNLLPLSEIQKRTEYSKVVK